MIIIDNDTGEPINLKAMVNQIIYHSIEWVNIGTCLKLVVDPGDDTWYVVDAAGHSLWVDPDRYTITADMGAYK